jgi:cytochrome c
MRYAAVFILCAITLVGCRTLEQMVPPVDPVIVNIGQEAGFNTASLERGRHIYLNGCIKCHAPEPIDRYSVAQWEKILPDMAIETKLTDAEAADVRAYVLAAHRMMMTQPKPQ